MPPRDRLSPDQRQAAMLADLAVRAERRHRHQPAGCVLSDRKVAFCWACGETRVYGPGGALLSYTPPPRAMLVLLAALLLCLAGAAPAWALDGMPAWGTLQRNADAGLPRPRSEVIEEPRVGLNRGAGSDSHSQQGGGRVLVHRAPQPPPDRRIGAPGTPQRILGAWLGAVLLLALVGLVWAIFFAEVD